MIYLYGEEQLLKEGLIRGIRQTVQELEDFNLDVFWMKELRGSDAHKQIFDTILAVPMMGNRRVIILRDFDFSRALENKFITALEQFNFPDTTILVIEADKLDKRKKTGKIIDNKFKVIQLNTPNDKEMLEWVSYFVSKVNKRITKSAGCELIKLSGISLSAVREEIRKLANFVDGDSITLTDVKNSVTHSRSAHIFQFSNAFSTLNFPMAMKLALELINFGERYSGIFFWMHRGLSDLLWASIDPSGLRKRLGKRSFLADDLLKSTRQITAAQILSSIYIIHRADMMVKSGIFDDKTALIWAISNIQLEMEGK